jgi:hypothetical protein
MSEEKLEPRIEPHMIPIESSTMKGFSYDEETEQLTIIFKNDARYVYEGVPWELVEEFKGSESKGRFFALEIKGVYPGVKQ